MLLVWEGRWRGLVWSGCGKGHGNTLVRHGGFGADLW